jgi:hypothetical protein
MKMNVKGISYSATERKYLVRIFRNSKRVYLGRFSSFDEAKKALHEEENRVVVQDEQPILSALRAEFASKNKKNKNVATAKPAKKPNIFVKMRNNVETNPSKNKKTPVAKNKNSKEIDTTIELIIKRLLEMADEQKTSVFDVIVREVARLSKQ